MQLLNGTIHRYGEVEYNGESAVNVLLDAVKVKCIYSCCKRHPEDSTSRSLEPKQVGIYGQLRCQISYQRYMLKIETGRFPCRTTPLTSNPPSRGYCSSDQGSDSQTRRERRLQRCRHIPFLQH